MRVVEETLLVPMVKLDGGLEVPYTPQLLALLPSVSIDHYYSRLVVEIDGRKLYAETTMLPELYSTMPRDFRKEYARRDLQNGALEFIRSELFK